MSDDLVKTLRVFAEPVPACVVERPPTRLYRRAADEIEQLRKALRYYWEETHSCPCGARRKSPVTHPHVPGCPVGRALEG